MSQHIVHFPAHQNVSPFDAIRQTRPDGSEYWSARDIQPLMGYADWRNLQTAISRAKMAVINTGEPLTSHVVDATKVVPRPQGGSINREDFELSRHAAYLTAINGDPEKPETAAAQSYFAVQTRVAETHKPLTGSELLAHAVIEAQAMLAQRDAKIAELEPKAEVAEKLLDASGDYSVKDAATILKRGGLNLGQNRLFSKLHELRWIYRDRADGCWRVYQTTIERGYMMPLPKSHYHPNTGELVLDPPQPRMTAKGIQKLLCDHGRGEQLQLTP